MLPLHQNIITFLTETFSPFSSTISPSLERPADAAHGDFATNFALVLFAQKKREGTLPDDIQSPRQMAEKLCQALNENISQQAGVLAKAEAAGPGFINLWLSSEWLEQELSEILELGPEYGKNTELAGQTWAIEHTSPNPNKAMHLGHLRNNLTGMALVHLSEASGARVIAEAVDNNRGIAIAKLMWGYLKFAKKEPSSPTELSYWYEHQDEWNTPEDTGERPDRFVDRLYVLGAQDCQEHAEAEDAARQLVRDWEAQDQQTWALWQKVLGYSYAGQQLTLERIGNRWDFVWHEHEHYQAGKDLVEAGLQSGVFRQLPDGAVLTTLEPVGLSDTIVQKSDGTALYITQDLALTALKKKTHQADRLFWVIGPEQSLALAQLFAVCEQLGIGKREEFTHISYGFMSLKGKGKMSSRAGSTVFIDELIDSVKERVREIMNASEFSPEQREATAESIALAAVKYSILKVEKNTPTEFDIESSIRVDGDSGPYLQYTAARCNAVLKKAEPGEKRAVYSSDLAEGELALWRYLTRLSEVVLQSTLNFSPSTLTQYLLSLAQHYNSFYNSYSILQADSPQQVSRRLALTQATSIVLTNGLRLLGIAVPEKM